MKRSVMLAAIGIAGFSAYAQPGVGDYELSFNFRITDKGTHGSNCDNKLDFYVTLEGQAEELKETFNITGAPERSGGWLTDGFSYQLPRGSKVTKIRIHGRWAYRKSDCCSTWCSYSDSEWNIDVDYTDCFLYERVDDLPPNWTTDGVIKIQPVRMSLFYYNGAGNLDNRPAYWYLPANHKVSVKATTGFPANTYYWYFSYNGSGPISLPRSLVSADGSVLTLSGNDLPGIGNFTEDLGVPGVVVTIYVLFGCDNKMSTTRPLKSLPSAPNIISIQEVPPSCSYYADGKVTVTFDRNLYPQETITFTKNAIGQAPADIAVLDAGNTYTMKNFAALERGNISITGKYKTQSTYTDNPQQLWEYTIPRRAPIVFDAVKADVHCNQGEDGIINITATGGATKYNATLFDGATSLQVITLTERSGNTFRELPIGLYTISIIDTLGCEPEAVKSLDREVNQPEFPTVLTLIDSIEPLGYGLSNGYITVRSASGTPNYTFEWTDGAGNPLTANAPVQEGVTMTSRLPNIGKGVYKVLAKDSQLALVSPVTPTNTRGCYDTLTLPLYEPPLLEVALAEYHYVSCFKYTDGEVVAHATGGRPYLAASPLPYQYDWFMVQDGAPVPVTTTDSISIERPSAVYRVRVTDRNGIIAWSDDFDLVQPDLLTINFNTSQLLCNGDANGTSVATVRGGTPAYEYAWSTEGETPAIDNLTEGWYSLVVKDVRGCTTFGQTEVKVPNSLNAEATLVPPVCNGYSDGSIALAVTGGVAPYRYEWEQGTTTAQRVNLGTGTYSVRVTDANDCFIRRDYKLDNPALLAIDLGPDRVLCQDQTLPLNIAFDDPAPQYRWTKDGALFAQTAGVDLVESGTYTATVSDSKGCHNSDEIRVTRSQSVIAASIMLASRGPVAQRVRVANISHPFPERVEWIIPPAATILEETPEYVDLSFAVKDVYTVGMVSYVGDCEKVAYNQVKIVDASELTDYKTPDQAFILQFSVTPNPNEGRFTATVELREASDFSLHVSTPQGTSVTSQQFRQQSFAQAEFDLTREVGPGVYVLQLITREGHASFKIVIH